MIRISIADDHPMVRDGLEAMLVSAGGFEVVSLSADGASALSDILAAKPDVVLSDVRMPVSDGFSLLSALAKAGSPAKVIFLAGMPLKEEERRAEEMGAGGYLPKEVGQERLVEAIREAAAGGGFVREEFQPAQSRLTQRELDTLKYVAQGKQRTEIAEIMGIGPESVKTHMKGVLNKLGAANSTVAVVKAYELGILRA